MLYQTVPHGTSGREIPWSLAELDDAALQLKYRRLAAEEELLATVIVDPARLLRVAISVGISRTTFDEDANRIIWCTMGVLAQERRLTGDRVVDQIAVQFLAERGLRADGWWSDRHECSGCHWNDARLEQLTDRYPSSVSAVRLRARELCELAARDDQARQGLRMLRSALIAPFREDKTLEIPERQRVLSNVNGNAAAKCEGVAA